MEGLPRVLQPLPGEGPPQPRVPVMKSRVEKQVQRTTTYLEFGATRSFRIPCPPHPMLGCLWGQWGVGLPDPG